MADLVAEAALSQDWTEVKAALGLQDGSKYLLDVHDAARRNSLALVAETDDASEPSITGQPVAIAAPGVTDSRQYTARAGVRLWMRVTRGTAKVSASEVP